MERVTQARVLTWTVRSGVKRANHEVTAPQECPIQKNKKTKTRLDAIP